MIKLDFQEPVEPDLSTLEISSHVDGSGYIKQDICLLSLCCLKL